MALTRGKVLAEVSIVALASWPDVTPDPSTVLHAKGYDVSPCPVAPPAPRGSWFTPRVAPLQIPPGEHRVTLLLNDVGEIGNRAYRS